MSRPINAEIALVHRDKIIEELLLSTNTFIHAEDYLINQEKVCYEIGTEALQSKFDEILEEINE